MGLPVNAWSTPYKINFIADVYDDSVLVATVNLGDAIAGDTTGAYRGMTLPMRTPTSRMLVLAWNDQSGTTIFSVYDSSAQFRYFEIPFAVTDAVFGECGVLCFFHCAMPDQNIHEKIPICAHCFSAKGTPLSPAHANDAVHELTRRYAKTIVVSWQLLPFAD